MVKIPKLKKPQTRKWPFALLLGLALGLGVLVDRGSLRADTGLSSPCRVEVTSDVLSVRTSAEPGARTSATLHRGDLRGARTTVRNGYRQLTDGGWVLDEFLRPLPGSKCAAL